MYEINYNVKRNLVKDGLVIFKRKGLFYFLKKFFYLYIFPFYKIIFLKKRTFSFNNKKFDYFFHFYNHAHSNERTIEIPLALSFINEVENKKNILEIGNVLSHYVNADWDILDKYESGKKIINSDIVNFISSKKYDLVISISTFEHIGFDEKKKDNKKIQKTILNIKNNLLKKNGRLVFTVPVGWNVYLDKIIKEEKIKYYRIFYFKRISWDNRWILSDKFSVLNTKFARPYIGANGLVLAIIKN